MAWQQGFAAPVAGARSMAGLRSRSLPKEELMACFEQCPESCSLAAEFKEVRSAYDTRHKHSP